KEAPSRCRRLEISETRKRGEQFVRDRIRVFEEDVPRFLSEVLRAVSVLGQPVNKEAVAIMELRKHHPRAYMPWSAEEEQKLRGEYKQGLRIDQLAIKHERQPGAIRSRLRRL